MSRMFAIVVVMSASTLCLAQNTNPSMGVPTDSVPTATSAQQSKTGEAQSAPAATIPIELAKSLDARKLKEGDPVQANVLAELRMGDGTIIPRGSKVMGHITKAEARAKGDSQSQLGISFDQIAIKGGREVPLKSSIQAVAPPPSYAAAAGENSQPALPGVPSAGPIGTGNPPAGVGAPPSNFPSNPSGGAIPPPSPANRTGSPQITPQSTGVVGLPDLQLESGSILASSGKNVKLEAGSQMLLRVQDQ